MASEPTIPQNTLTPDHIIRHTTLRQLQIFEAIVRLGSFTRAAEELFLTQPTVSMQTKKLSDALGLPLFEQVGRNARPTEAGRELYEASQKIFEVLSNLDMKLSDLKGIRRGRLRLGVITTAKYYAPELLGEFLERYPGIEVELKVTNRERILERLFKNRDDLYIMGQAPSGQADIDCYPVALNPLVVCAPSNHPLVGQKNIPLERLASEPLILREKGSGIRDAALRRFSEQGLTPQVRMELGSNEAIKHSIVNGLGVAVLSLHTLTPESSGGPLALLDVEGFPIMRTWYFGHLKGKELSLVAQTFLDYALESEQKLRARMESKWPEIRDHLHDAKLMPRPKPGKRRKGD